MKIHAPLAAVLAASLGGSALAQPAAHCSRETLTVKGTPVQASICVAESGPANGHDLPVRVDQTFTGPKGSVSMQSTLRFIAGEPDSRVLEDVPLDRLGLEGTLHLTLLLRSGGVRIDAAMLTPGAVTVK